MPNNQNNARSKRTKNQETKTPTKKTKTSQEILVKNNPTRRTRLIDLYESSSDTDSDYSSEPITLNTIPTSTENGEILGNLINKHNLQQLKDTETINFLNSWNIEWNNNEIEMTEKEFSLYKYWLKQFEEESVGYNYNKECSLDTESCFYDLLSNSNQFYEPKTFIYNYFFYLDNPSLEITFLTNISGLFFYLTTRTKNLINGGDDSLKCEELTDSLCKKKLKIMLKKDVSFFKADHLFLFRNLLNEYSKEHLAMICKVKANRYKDIFHHPDFPKLVISLRCSLKRWFRILKDKNVNTKHFFERIKMLGILIDQENIHLLEMNAVEIQGEANVKKIYVKYILKVSSYKLAKKEEMAKAIVHLVRMIIYFDNLKLEENNDKTDRYDYALADTDLTSKMVSRVYKWVDHLELQIMDSFVFMDTCYRLCRNEKYFGSAKEFKERIASILEIEGESIEIEEEKLISLFDANQMLELTTQGNVNILISPDFVKTFNSQILNNDLKIQCFYVDKTAQSGATKLISFCKLRLVNDIDISTLIEELNLSLSTDNLNKTLQNPPQQTQQPLGSPSSSNSDSNAKFLSANSTLFEQLQELHSNSESELEKELLRFGLFNIKRKQRIKGSDRLCFYANCSSVYKEEDNIFLKLSIGRLENVSLMEKIVKENIRHPNISTIFRYGVISHKTLTSNPYLNLLKSISPDDFSKLEINCNDNLQSDIYYTIQEPLVKKEQYQNEIKKKEVKTIMILLIKLFYDCLFGIKFLNNLNIMHCDLSMQNILFRKSNLNHIQGYYHGKVLKYLKNLTTINNQLVIYDAVLIDLNNAHFISDYSHPVYRKSTTVYGTEPYCPSVHSFTEHHDLFSLGIIFAEYLKFILTGNYKFNADTKDTAEYMKEIDRYFTFDNRDTFYNKFVNMMYERLIKKMIWRYSKYKVQDFIVTLNFICEDIFKCNLNSEMITEKDDKENIVNGKTGLFNG
ncbi:hypothetical protein ABK040_016217 [Willaertia magna]